MRSQRPERRDMTQPQPAQRAVVLSTFDLPDANSPLRYGCEDCACAVSPTWLPSPSIRSSHWSAGTRLMRGREVMEIPLTRGWHVLFNPVGHGGAVVVNEPVRRMLARLGQPVTMAEALADEPGLEMELAQAMEDLAKHGMIHAAELVPRAEFADSRMLTAWLHITNACNLRCPYCYVNKSAEGMDPSVGRATVEAVLKSAVAHNFPAVKLKYAGGEASLNHRLMLSLHDHARVLAVQHGIALHATLLSNGVRLSPALIEALKTRDIRVMISLDGIGEQHDVQRPFINGKPSFEHVERTISLLRERDHAPHLSVTVTNRNCAGLAEVVRFALERNLTFSLNFFRDNDCAARFSDLQYEERAMIRALREAFAVIADLLPRWSVLGSILDRGQLLEPRQRSCGVGQDYVVIDQRGRIAKCHMEIERTIGDVFRDDPLLAIRHDATLVQNLAVDEKEGCRDCTWRYWCSGGCAVATFRATGRYDIKSPNCNIYKAIYPEALRLEGLRILKYSRR
jgi:uncharacterized protein